ncbi:tripartite tricarboxylate transporter TctB family protein [Rhizobium sp. NTR19]|uniref:Tripartite tricarboxylate transporter TctB family protein n=1 Tax=Neorhizobium turbinariae TaxID=2937795 RepID=A0ABT0ILL6_9HYPH|nr:tripartite tricarboxylate transporter TctB family protein [Neorhizobium turbinariae]MCK8778771.1 tripartite tricarboxylate transporter TctB family protein [Neorhizobium turbinariae]
MHFQADHAVGILFVAIGGIAVYLGFDYGFGDMSEMGPGALPVLLGTVLFLFGIALIVQTTLANAGSSGTSIMPREEVRPFLAVLAALLAFGLLIDHVGLLPSVLALIGIGWLADKRSRLKELPILVTAIVAIIIGIFYFGLGIPFHLVDWSV